MKSVEEKFYPEVRFGGFTDIDGTVLFYLRVKSLLEQGDTVIDFGCGRGAQAADEVEVRRSLVTLRNKAGRVIGLDVDQAGEGNPLIDEFRPIVPGERWPIEDSSVGLIVADNVIEHLPDPDKFFGEARRVLRVGGHLCIRTPNAMSYIGIAARLISNRFHQAVLRKVQRSRRDEDVFPTLYRCNTTRSVRRAYRKHGFDAVVYGYESEPRYMAFSSFAYWLATLHQRFAPRVFAPAIFAFGRKEQ